MKFSVKADRGIFICAVPGDKRERRAERVIGVGSMVRKFILLFLREEKS